MKTLSRILNSFKQLSGWRIQEKQTISNELFFVRNKLETVRSTDTRQTVVTVYLEHDGAIGDSTFNVYASMTEEDIAKKIENALLRAALVFNEPYKLVEGGKFEGTVKNNINDCDFKDLLSAVTDAVYAADVIDGGSINALELFVYKDVIRVTNSRGVDKTQTACRVMIEAIPTFTTEKESVELYESYTFTDFDKEKITREIAAKMKEVSLRSKAVKPTTPMTADVALRPKEIAELLEELAYNVNYACVYAQGNLYKKGDDIQKGCVGDRMTLTMRAVMEGSPRSAYFDGDGTTLSDVTIIKDGVVSDYFGNMRFGQYLGVEKPSGDLKCMQLECGTLSAEQLKSQPYIECVSLSGLQVDANNDYIGGEIRLAYYFDGKSTVPVTGITMSAKLSEVLKTLRLADKEDVDGAYKGPEFLLMKDVTIL